MVLKENIKITREIIKEKVHDFKVDSKHNYNPIISEKEKVKDQFIKE
jgi:hypothetical protein